MKCHCSLLADFKNGDKKILKCEQIQLHSRKVHRKKKIMGRKLIICNSNKMQPLIKVSKT